MKLRIGTRGSALAELVLVALGAWAHIRGDLGRAISTAAFGKGGLDRTDLETMFGPLSDAAFLAATQEFFHRRIARAQGPRQAGLRAQWRLIAPLAPLWLPLFQLCRRLSYRACTADLAARAAS